MQIPLNRLSGGVAGNISIAVEKSLNFCLYAQWKQTLLIQYCSLWAEIEMPCNWRHYEEHFAWIL